MTEPLNRNCPRCDWEVAQYSTLKFLSPEKRASSTYGFCRNCSWCNDPESTASTTGHYEITTYREPNQTKSVWQMEDAAGDTYYHLNDDHLDVGPFVDWDAAIAHAKHCIMDYRDIMGGRVNSIAVINEGAEPDVTEITPPRFRATKWSVMREESR
jgi:hypothetical protein